METTRTDYLIKKSVFLYFYPRDLKGLLNHPQLLVFWQIFNLLFFAAHFLRFNLNYFDACLDLFVLSCHHIFKFVVKKENKVVSNKLSHVSQE